MKTKNWTWNKARRIPKVCNFLGITSETDPVSLRFKAEKQIRIETIAQCRFYCWSKWGVYDTWGGGGWSPVHLEIRRENQPRGEVDILLPSQLCTSIGLLRVYPENLLAKTRWRLFSTLGGNNSQALIFYLTHAREKNWLVAKGHLLLMRVPPQRNWSLMSQTLAIQGLLFWAS